MRKQLWWNGMALCICCLAAATASAQQSPAEISMAGGELTLQAPETWVRKAPQTRIVEHEFAIPAAKGDATDGRLTVMGAGGSVEANIDRWYAQFTQPGGGSTRDAAKVKQIKAAGHDVHLVDISGTFKDQRGPMAPAIERPKYRMLAAIVTTKDAGNYFLKFYGPEKTVTENEAAFVKMMEGLKKK
jgi:hypothetical protein